jgi:hypothetical protein
MRKYLPLAAVLVIAAAVLFIEGDITGNAVYEPHSEIDVYFCPEDMCLEKMLALIREAEEIKCAFYDINLPELISLLKDKYAEVVVEDSTHNPGFYTGYSPALMHNKFCILDRYTVITGSMNPTERDNYYNNNNLVIIRSKAISQNYLDEFYELRSNQYGKGNKVRNPVVHIGNIKIENYFCPEDNCKLRVINALRQANASIYFMTFSFTDEDIGNLIWNKDYEGLDVKGIFEKRQISQYSRYEDLKGFSIIDKNSYTMHHKVFIIDNKTVITGSFNPSRNANERNDENIIIIHDRDIALKYVREFEKLFYYHDDIPEQAAMLALYRILYDPKGRDEGNEVVELMNIGNTEIKLAYYFLSDNKTATRLNGTIMPGEVKRAYPKFALKNTNGILILRNTRTVDFVAWKGYWDLDSGEGNYLIRKDISINPDAWAIARSP